MSEIDRAIMPANSLRKTFQAVCHDSGVLQNIHSGHANNRKPGSLGNLVPDQVMLEALIFIMGASINL